MANYEVNVPKGILSGLLAEKDALARLVKAVLSQILEAQMSEHLKAKPYERSEDRQGWRNGSWVRVLTTWGGPLDPPCSQGKGRKAQHRKPTACLHRPGGLLKTRPPPELSKRPVPSRNA